MQNRILAIIISMLLAVQLLVSPVQASNVSLTLNASTAAVGNTVIASGSADANTWVSIKILDDSQSIIFFEAVKSDAHGKYSMNIKIPDLPYGVVTFVAGYGDNVASKTMNIGDKLVLIENVSSGISSSSSGSGGGKTTSNQGSLSQPIDAPTSIPTVVLTDIDNHWAADSIKKLVTAGAINGYADGSFKPENKITRAEFVTIVVKAFKLETDRSRVFDDTADHWSRDYISSAVTNGIANGYSAQNFGPDDFITREQMAVMIVNAAKLTGATGELSFTDSMQVSSWAKEALLIACQNNIISGYPDNLFIPAGFATRAEAVAVIVKALK